jgi:Family of unknown function (DUF6206)
MDAPEPAALQALEASVQRALEAGAPTGLDIIGYGEITTVVRLRSAGGAFACKRLAPFPDDASAKRCVECIRRYVAELERHRVDVLDTELATARAFDGRPVVYCIQPELPAGSLGPDHLRGLAAAETEAPVRRIFECLRRAVTPRLAPDGQLSNWAFVEERLYYLDVSTPFLRDELGRELFDFSQQTRALPTPMRLVVDRFLLRGILDNYHSTRGQALDFLGNLHKEGLAPLVARLVALANDTLDLDPPVTVAAVRAHYRRDARTYAAIQAARRADRWWHRRVLHRPYPYLLPPPIARGL